jgi:3-methylcrotonyl-CoA carboxylase alpha subunit
METRLRCGEREFVVRVASDGDGFVASVDGVSYALSCTPIGCSLGPDGTVIEELVLAADGRPQRVVLARQRGRLLVAAGGGVYAIEVGADAHASRSRHQVGSTAVVAPMPGRIVTVLVQAGDEVEAGRPVAILEAMKMETVLAAEIDGRVARVLAAAGDTVDGGALLLEITPRA